LTITQTSSQSSSAVAVSHCESVTDCIVVIVIEPVEHRELDANRERHAVGEPECESNDECFSVV